MPESAVLEDAPKGTLPEPPPVQRHIVLTGRQRVGIPIMLLIVILALSGLLGEHMTRTTAEEGGIAATVVYPDRIHYRQQMPMTITVHNTAPVSRDTMIVSLDTAYMARFLISSVMPSVARAYDVVVTDVAPGASRIVMLQVAGERAGRARGVVTVRSGRNSVQVPLSTFIFP